MFGDGIVICGTDTYKLTVGSPEQITDSVFQIDAVTRNTPGFAICSPGGVHNNIPIENLEAYFDARVEVGFTPKGWRKGRRSIAQSFVPH